MITLHGKSKPGLPLPKWGKNISNKQTLTFTACAFDREVEFELQACFVWSLRNHEVSKASRGQDQPMYERELPTPSLPPPLNPLQMHLLALCCLDHWGSMHLKGLSTGRRAGRDVCDPKADVSQNGNSFKVNIPWLKCTYTCRVGGRVI